MTNSRTRLGIGMVGYAFMGAAHSQAWRVAPRFFDLPLDPEMTALCGRDGEAVSAAAAKFGWASVETDWRELIARDDIDLVDIASPGNTHAEIAIAALAAGKHVLCEKPLANSVAEAEAMATAARQAAKRGVYAMTGFSYRRLPAVALARTYIEQAKLGTIRQVRAAYQQDWLVDPQAPLAWRLKKEIAGSGALGDIAAHIVDMTQYLLGQPIVATAGQMETFIKTRPLPGSTTVAGTPNVGDVTVDDAAWFLGRFASGVIGSFEATRFATGRKNALTFEVFGSEGALAFNLEDMNSLRYYDNTKPAVESGFQKILVSEPEHPYYSAWWPAGHFLRYEHSFSHQVVDLITAIASGVRPLPSFDDGLAVQKVLAAVERSTAAGAAWTEV